MTECCWRGALLKLAQVIFQAKTVKIPFVVFSVWKRIASFLQAEGCADGRRRAEAACYPNFPGQAADLARQKSWRWPTLRLLPASAMRASRPPSFFTAAASCTARSTCQRRASEAAFQGSMLLRSVPLNSTGSCNPSCSQSLYLSVLFIT